MKHRVWIALIMLSSASWGGQMYDGNRLYELCRGGEQSYQVGGCEGFIIGVSDTLNASKNQRELNRRICLPRRTTGQQLRRVVVDYLALVPQLRGYDATFLVELALRTAYPCTA